MIVRSTFKYSQSIEKYFSSTYTQDTSFGDKVKFLRREWVLIAGVDEVGRGPLAGPVVTAAVILSEPIEGLMDSKQLTPKKRKML